MSRTDKPSPALCATSPGGKSKLWIVWLLRIAVFAALVIADQIVKKLTETNADKLPVKVVGGVLDITYTTNTGAAFSMLTGARWFFVVIVALSLAAIAFILIKGYFKSAWGVWGLIFVAGGALGNGIDRALHGYVVDMFEFKFINFAVFNVADVWVTTGAICLFVYLFFYFDKEHRQEARSKKQEARSERQEARSDSGE